MEIVDFFLVMTVSALPLTLDHTILWPGSYDCSVLLSILLVYCVSYTNLFFSVSCKLSLEQDSSRCTNMALTSLGDPRSGRDLFDEKKQMHYPGMNG
jgi:hypothetical protein